MAALRNRNAVVLAKIESSEGTDASPAATDAILIDGIPRISPQANIIQTNEVTGSLDGFGDIVGGMRVDVSFDVFLKGSGAAATAPEFGDLLKACGWSETITSTAVPSSAEALASGASTTAATLGSSASSTAQAYRGMPINFSSTVVGSSFITNYTAGKVATLTDTLGGTLTTSTNYQIPVNVLYKPASSSIPTISLYVYMDGVIYKILGCRGTFTLSIDSGGVGKFTFNFSGMFDSKADTSVPTATYDSTRPPVFKDGIFTIQRVEAATQNISLDCGNTLAFPDNPNSLEGFDPAVITRRKLTGSINPLETLVATRDIMTDFRAGTNRIIHARWGGTTGNKIGITIPSTLYTGQNPGDRDGLATVDVPFDAVGQDSGAFLCFY